MGITLVVLFRIYWDRRICAITIADENGLDFHHDQYAGNYFTWTDIELEDSRVPTGFIIADNGCYYIHTNRWCPIRKFIKSSRFHKLGRSFYHANAYPVYRCRHMWRNKVICSCVRGQKTYGRIAYISMPDFSERNNVEEDLSYIMRIIYPVHR